MDTNYDQNLAPIKKKYSVQKKSKLQHFDVAIVGAGLSGMLLAKSLCKHNLSVALIEKQSSLGGIYRKKESLWDSSGLNFIPSSEENQKLIGWFESILDQKIYSGDSDTAPLTFQEGSFKPFLGFGNMAFTSAKELSYFNPEREMKLHSSPAEWITALSSQLSAQLFLNSEVTDFSMAPESHDLVSLTINGNQKLAARQFVLCTHPRMLLEFCSPESLSHSYRKKVSKLAPWTSLELSFDHSVSPFQSLPATFANNPPNDPLLFLNGSNCDFQPCVGRYFHLPAQKGHSPATTQHAANPVEVNHISRWLTLLSSDLAINDEAIGSAIRNMKRQIKRALGDFFFESCLNEKITIAADSFGKLPNSLKKTGLTNLTLSHHGLAVSSNLLGLIEATQLNLEELLSKLKKNPVLPDDKAQPLEI